MPKSTNVPLIAGAAIVGAAVLTGSLIVKSSLDRTASQLEAVRAGLANTQRAIQALAVAQATRPNEPRRAGPDPAKAYAIDTAGAPSRGALGGKVRIVEFSDFQ